MADFVPQKWHDLARHLALAAPRERDACQVLLVYGNYERNLLHGCFQLHRITRYRQRIVM